MTRLPVHIKRLRLLGLFLFALFIQSEAESAESLSITGFSEPFRLINTATPESGIIKEIAVKEGDRVKAGDILVMLDTSVLDALYNVARARSQADGTIKALAVKSDLRRKMFIKMKELRASEAATLNEVDKANADLQIAEAELESAREQIEIYALECQQIRAQIDRRSIRSPIDGVVIHVTKEVTESVSVANPHILTIADLSQLKIVCHEMPAKLPPLSIGDVVQVQDEEAGISTEGQISYVSPVVDAESGTVKIEIVVPNQNGNLRSGSRCKAYVEK